MTGSKGFGKILQSLPWTGIRRSVGAAFFAASILSVYVAHLLFSMNDSGTSRSRASASTDVKFNVPNQVASVNQKQLDAILERNIFDAETEGEVPATDDGEKPDVSDEDDAVRSSLPIKLVGTIYGGDPLSGIALVENTSKRTINSFMVGDTLTQGAKLVEVLRERIIFIHKERREYVDVLKTELVRSKRTKKKAKPAKTPGISPLATNPPPSTFKEEGFERKGSESVMSDSYRQKLLTTDFTKVLQDAKATPNMIDGELRGFKLTRIRQDSIYEKAGLQNDDIVEEVNGVPLTDTAQAIKLLQSLRNENEIEIRVRRGGSVQTMNLTIQ